MDWEDNFQSRILDRGYDYFRQGLVVKGKKMKTMISAIVRGTQDYTVLINLEDGEVVEARCDCPYATGGKYCKHMAAVLFWAFDDDVVPDSSHDPSVAELMATATDEQVRAFLMQLLQENGQLAAEFSRTILPITMANLQEYQAEVEAIFEDYMDEDDFIDYNSASYFEEELATFIRQNNQQLIEQGHLKLCFELTTLIVVKLARLDIDDSDGELMMLADICQEDLQQLIDQADQALKRQIFEWLQQHVKDSMLVFEDVLEDLLAHNFNESEFLSLKLAWSEQKLQQAQKQQSEWQAERWALFHLHVMEKVGSTPTAVKTFCLANIELSDVRKYYVTFCLRQKDYATAISQLQLGKAQAESDQRWRLLATYSRQLKDIYRQLKQPAAYREELWRLVTVYQPADLGLYRELKQQYSPDEWKIQRDKLFATLPKRVDIAPLYAEEHLYRQLLKRVLAQPSLVSVATYEQVLKPKFSAQLLQKYVAVAEKMAEQTGDRKHYRAIVKVLDDMTSYPLGTNEAKRLIQEWHVKYARRSAMMDELSHFRG